MRLALLAEKWLKRKKSEELEAGLPFALMHLRTRLLLGEKLEDALEGVAKTAKSGAGKEFGKIGKEIRQRGATAGEALLHAIERSDSLQFKRTCSHLAGLAAGGRQGIGSLKALHREIIAGQRAKIKDFSGKMAVYSLVFVAFSTVLPALFLAFVLVGSMFLKLGISPATAFLAIILGFPLVDAAVLLFIREKTPVFARQ